MSRKPFLFLLLAVSLFASQQAFAQAPPANEQQRMDDIERRLNDATNSLTQAQQALEQSMREVQRLRAELDALRSTSVKAAPAPTSIAPTPAATDISSLHEEQQAIQAEIKQHDQIKVETTSKYPLRVTGLILFNASSVAGVVDDAQLPSIALPRFAGGSHGSLQANMRQTVLGLEANGPSLWGARSTGQVSADFFGGVSTNASGYSSPTGYLRMRTAEAGLDWQNTNLHAGVSEPIITPLSPTSYATVAEPALSASGNLWAWAPQLRVEQRIPFSDRTRLAFEGALIDPGTSVYTTQLVSPSEASRRPGYEGRISYQFDGPASATPHPFAIGIGGYSSSQFYNSTTHIHPWAVTADWQIPLTRHFELTGEFYRGRSLGGFGAGEYKDLITGTDNLTGLTRSTGVDTAGGWSQLKLFLGSTLEANLSYGLDNAFSSNFENLTISTTTSSLALNARNSSIISNVIFRPKTYLIFSPEYRRIESWRYIGSRNTANIFTITAGYQF